MPSVDAPSPPRTVTLTMNPALDLTTSVDHVRPADKMRCSTPRYDPGGGGVNVARIATTLGLPTTAVFPAGGVTGELIIDLLRREQVPHSPVAIEGLTRISFTVNDEATTDQYRFVLPGPILSQGEQTACLDRLAEVAHGARYLVASGSLPPGTPADTYQQVAELCRELDVLFLLDTSGGGLSAIRSGVFLLKPSVRELRERCGRALSTEAEQLTAAQELIDIGLAQFVLVSLGADGALLATPQDGYRYPAVPVPPGSGVGAGDALVAGVVVGLSRGRPLLEAVALGVAAGAAMLLTPGTATCTAEDVNRLLDLAEAPTELQALAGP